MILILGANLKASIRVSAQGWQEPSIEAVRIHSEAQSEHVVASKIGIKFGVQTGKRVRMCHKAGTGCSGLKRGAAFQNRGADSVFKGADALRNRRLRHRQIIGGSLEASGSHDRRKRRELGMFKH